MPDVEDWEAIINAPQEWWTGFFHPPSGFEKAILRDFVPWITDGEKLSKAYKVWRGKDRLESCVVDGILDLPRHEVAMRNFERALFPRVHGCQMFTTSSPPQAGAVAGNCRTQIGDELWLLSGGLTPFVLRRVSEGDHVLITPCYLKGHMYCIDEIVNIYANSGVSRNVTLV